MIWNLKKYALLAFEENLVCLNLFYRFNPKPDYNKYKMDKWTKYLAEP